MDKAKAGNKPAEQVDIFNASERTYHLRDGRALDPKRTQAVDADEAEALIKSYPGQIVSPDTYRSEGGTSRRHLALELQLLREENALLKGQMNAGDPAALAVGLTDAQAKVAKLEADLASAQGTIETLQGAAEQAKADTAAIVADAQAKVEAAENGLAAFKAEIGAMVDAESKRIDAVVDEYNAALDALPEGAKAPHFSLGTPETQPSV